MKKYKCSFKKCNNEIQPTPRQIDYINRGKHIFCSTKCSVNHRNSKRKNKTEKRIETLQDKRSPRQVVIDEMKNPKSKYKHENQWQKIIHKRLIL